MDTTILKEIKTIELDWYDEGDVVSVCPRDLKRFEVQKDRAIEILRIAQEHADRFQSQLTLLLGLLANWVDSHRASVDKGLVTMQDGSFMFIALKRTALYDEQFEDDLSDLDFELAQDKDLDLIRVNVMSLPPVSQSGLRSFVDEGFLLSYDVHRERPHRLGEQESRDTGVSSGEG